ncbi:phosphotransferase [Nocardia sp. CA-128927]|uniref:phosphotransferase n=1 Tax=Nocardia sp. CA-128927 TaxID=3239975 RepID=UPI003D997280
MTVDTARFGVVLMPDLPADLVSTADAAGIRVTEVRHRTDKTALAIGELSGQRVAVKCLLDPDPLWAAKWRHELDAYRVFATVSPPLRVPKLLYTDNSRILVLEWLDGRRLNDDRYPQQALSVVDSEAVLSCVAAFNQWQPPGGAFAAVFDYADRFRRYHAQGWLEDRDLAALQKLLPRAGTPAEVNHGDPIASNILLGDHCSVTLLDWEYTGLFLPGFDLAMMHTQLGANTSSMKERIDAMVSADGNDTPFVINLATVLTRELRIHRELPASHVREMRLEMIEPAWVHARERLHRQATMEM